jgi:hypothetical protein
MQNQEKKPRKAQKDAEKEDCKGGFRVIPRFPWLML